MQVSHVPFLQFLLHLIMNIIFSIFRWLLGLFFGLTMLVAVVALVPMSVAGKQLFERESGMQWITGFTQDQQAVEAFIDGFLVSLSTADQIEEPAIKELLKYAADRKSPLGMATRKILSPESVSENMLRNADLFYDWADGTSEKLVLTYKLGGTSTEQAALVSEFLKQYYDGLERCTASEMAGYKRNDPTSVIELGCSVGPLTSASFTTIATELMKDPVTKKMLKEGFVYDTQVTAEDRKGVVVLQKTFGAGIVVAWLIIVVSTLFMIILFVPRGVNFITAGIIVGLTGISVIGTGKGLGAVAVILKDTLGDAISYHGLLIAVAGLALLVVGIGLVAREGEKRSESVEARKGAVKA